MDRMMADMEKNISEGKSDPGADLERKLFGNDEKLQSPSCTPKFVYEEPSSEPRSREI